MTRVHEIFLPLVLSILLLVSSLFPRAHFQDWVGDLGLGEGSVQHAALHGFVGCASSTLSGGNCASGAVGGIAQSLYAGSLGDHSKFTDEQEAQYASNAQLIGASAGLFFSEGKAENVAGAGSIAGSGFVNNYLNHEQRKDADSLSEEKKKLLRACGNGPGSMAAPGCSRLLEIDRELAVLEQVSTRNTLALKAACVSDPGSLACKAGVADAKNYVTWADQGDGRSRFNVDYGTYYNPALAGKGGGSADDAIVRGYETLAGVSSGNRFASAVDAEIDDRLWLQGGSRLRDQAALLEERATWNDDNDPPVASTCHGSTEGSSYSCMMTQRDRIDEQIANHNIADFFVPMTTTGVIVEIVGLGAGPLFKLGGKTVARFGDNFVEVAEDGAGGYRAVERATNNAPDLTKFSTQDRRSYNTLERRIVEHEQKLADFKANPTVRPGMENQPPDVIRAAQERRILHLEREITAFRKNQNDIVANYE